MKTWGLIILGWLAALPWGVQAQIKVELTLDQTEYLSRESLIVGVRITNLSGQTLQLGKDNDWLKFMVENQFKGPVMRLGAAPVKGEYEVENSKVATRYINVGPYFDLSEPGRYRITALVAIEAMKLSLSSAPKEFDIVKGIKLWEQSFGVPPGAGATNGAPQFRKYVLQQSANLDQIRMYVRVTDLEENQVLRVAYIGRMVSFSQPEAQVDGASNLHVLYQSGARSFLYCKVNPDGRLIIRQTHLHSNTRPRLHKDEDGNIRVVGGIRRRTTDDIPSSESSETAPNSVPTTP